MCVSAEASFALGGVLAPVGAYCLKNAVQRDRRALALAAVPLLFGVQQVCEGLVWTGLNRDDPGLARGAAYAYLFFALVFWLFWIPFSALRLETRQVRRRWLVIGGLLGVAGGLVLYLPIVFYPETLMVRRVQHSIEYDFSVSPIFARIPALIWHLLYLAVICWPLFLVARNRQGVVALSVTLVLSAVISHAYFWYAFTSVWCFFAAILSLVLGYAFARWPRPCDRAAS